MSRLQRQAAALPYRTSPHGGFEVLLVSRQGGGWGLPKGGVKKGHTPERTAALEALEEAGVLGQLGAQLGSFDYRKAGRKRHVLVFPLHVEQVLERWEEDDVRLRVWVALPEAPRMVERRDCQRLLVRFRHELLTGQIEGIAQGTAHGRPPALRLVA